MQSNIQLQVQCPHSAKNWAINKNDIYVQKAEEHKGDTCNIYE